MYYYEYMRILLTLNNLSKLSYFVSFCQPVVTMYSTDIYTVLFAVLYAQAIAQTILFCFLFFFKLYTGLKHHHFD